MGNKDSNSHRTADTAMKVKLNKDCGLQTRWTRTPVGNSGLAKVAVSFSADNFVVYQSSVLRINICSKNRHLRQSAKVKQYSQA